MSGHGGEKLHTILGASPEAVTLQAENPLKHLIVTGVKLSNEVLGRGTYGTVYKAYHNGIPCAAKLVDLHTKRNKYFIQECLQHSQLKHENLVTMFGVMYHCENANANAVPKPILIMELMEYTFAELFLNDEGLFFPMYVKLSILQDISAGICYLHTICNPPMVHGALTPENILLSGDLVAKLGDFGDTRVAHSSHDSRVGSVRVIGAHGFGNSFYNKLPQDVFGFGQLAYNAITQKQLCYRERVMYTTVAVICENPRYNFDHTDEINEEPLRELVLSCLNSDLVISKAHERITDIKAEYYSNNTVIKNAYSLALRKGQARLKDLQVQLVGAENTGKTCLISSFLDEEFVEGQAATDGADVEVCKISSRNWTRSTDCDKTNYLHNVFVQYFRGNAFKHMIMQSLVKPELKSTSCSKCEASSSSVAMAHKSSCGTPLADHENDLTKAESTKETQTPMQYDLIAVFWDFAGQAIFHNSHSAFISDSGVIMITFNASMKLTDKIVPREGSHQPPECHTTISSIHYWLQVVHSMCSVQENVLLVGTHIDKLHDDIEEARKIAKNTILPQLHEELKFKLYTCHLAGFRNQYKRYTKLNLKYALEKCCFFVSNKCRDKGIHRLRAVAIEVGTSLQKKQPIYFLKIEQALMQLKEPIISRSQMLDLVTKNTFALPENSQEFEGTLRYFHDKRIILHFSHIESLKNVVILSPHWLAKLFGYVIAADSFEIGNDAEVNKASERLHKYGILHDCLLQHMLKKFQSEYPGAIQVTEQQVVDILLHFHLVARITKEAWFSEEGFPSPPGRGDTFIVPCLVPRENLNTIKNIPKTKQERIIYYQFSSQFVPVYLLNQLITDCICRNVKRNSRLLWMRYGKIGLQLGAHQKYYISRCDEKQSIQLTITVDGNDSTSMEERKELIDDILQLIGNIMKLFMPTVIERTVILFQCPLCNILHITMDEVCSGNTIYCAISSDDAVVPREYYNNLLPTKPAPPQFLTASNLSDRTLLAQKPDMHLLNKIVTPRIMSEWKAVAYSMGYSPYHVCAIQMESNNNLRQCCDNLFANWLKTSSNPTWKFLLVSIKDIVELTAAVETIQKELVSVLGRQSQEKDVITTQTGENVHWTCSML